MMKWVATQNISRAAARPSSPAVARSSGSDSEFRHHYTPQRASGSGVSAVSEPLATPRTGSSLRK
eukprot:1616287-Pleurochrysis_carterae.AAC.2